jgi:hypothetical protein
LGQGLRASQCKPIPQKRLLSQGCGDIRHVRGRKYGMKINGGRKEEKKKLYTDDVGSRFLLNVGSYLWH